MRNEKPLPFLARCSIGWSYTDFIQNFSSLFKEFIAHLVHFLVLTYQNTSHDPRVPVQSSTVAKFRGHNIFRIHIFSDALYTAVCAYYYNSSLGIQTFQRHNAHIGLGGGPARHMVPRSRQIAQRPLYQVHIQCTSHLSAPHTLLLFSTNEWPGLFRFMFTMT